MAERIPDRLVVAAVLRLQWARDRVLVARRKGGPPSLSGLWEFPGGHVEAGEQPDVALARELHEEVGVLVAPEALRPIYVATLPWVDRGDLRCVCAFYVADVAHDGFALGGEHSGVRWAHWNDLAEYDLTPAARHLRAVSWRLGL